MTRTILAIGDSLTWGADPITKRRHPADSRWPEAMKTVLGNRISVVTEALCGRTTSFDDFAVAEERNATRSMPLFLGSHQPLSLVIIMLGTNDLKPHICGLAQGAQAGMKRLIQQVRKHPYIDGAVPEILLMAPPPRIATSARPEVTDEAIKQSRLLAPFYRQLAQSESIWFFDAGEACTASPADGVHLDAAQTRHLGHALADYLEGKLHKLSDY